MGGGGGDGMGGVGGKGDIGESWPWAGEGGESGGVAIWVVFGFAAAAEL